MTQQPPPSGSDIDLDISLPFDSQDSPGVTSPLPPARSSFISNYDEFEIEEDFDGEELGKAMDEAERRYRAQIESSMRHVDGRAMLKPLKPPFKVGDIEDIVPDQIESSPLPSQSTVTPLVFAKDAEQIQSQELKKDGEAEISLAPFFQFRKRGFFNVTDLAAPVWCETQVTHLIGHMGECRLIALL